MTLLTTLQIERKRYATLTASVLVIQEMQLVIVMTIIATVHIIDYYHIVSIQSGGGSIVIDSVTHVLLVIVFSVILIVVVVFVFVFVFVFAIHFVAQPLIAFKELFRQAGFEVLDLEQTRVTQQHETALLYQTKPSG